MDSCLLDFDENSKLDFNWESEYFRQFNILESDTLFELKIKLSISRVPNPKSKKLEFLVNREYYFKSDPNYNCDDIIRCKSEQEAIEQFNSIKEETEFLVEESKKGIVFDGHRYFWKVENGIITEKV